MTGFLGYSILQLWGDVGGLRDIQQPESLTRNQLMAPKYGGCCGVEGVK